MIGTVSVATSGVSTVLTNSHRETKRRFVRESASQNKKAKIDTGSKSDEGSASSVGSLAKALESIKEWNSWIKSRSAKLTKLLRKDYETTKTRHNICAICSTPRREVTITDGEIHFCEKMHFTNVRKLALQSGPKDGENALEQVFQTHFGKWAFHHVTGDLRPADDIA